MSTPGAWVIVAVSLCLALHVGCEPAEDIPLRKPRRNPKAPLRVPSRFLRCRSTRSLKSIMVDVFEEEFALLDRLRSSRIGRLRKTKGCVARPLPTGHSVWALEER